MTICLVDSSRDKELTTVLNTNNRVATVVINALDASSSIRFEDGGYELV